jgi:biopolymer transport protein ExbD
MARPERDSHNMIVDINIAPFTDVVLVLLIIFMVATPLLMMEGLRVELPAAKRQAETVEKEDMFITISITRDGTVFVDGKKCGIDQLKLILQQLIKINPNSIVTIGAEPEALYDTVVQVVDSARAAGVSRYVLAK